MPAFYRDKSRSKSDQLLDLRDSVHPLLISSGVHATAARRPEKTAIICNQVKRNYRELSERISLVAGLLQASGIRRGDRIAIVSQNCLEYPEVVCGISDIGAIAVTLNPRLTSRELSDSLQDCSARWVFFHPELAATTEEARPSTVEKTLMFGNEYEALLAASIPTAPDPEVLETDPFTLVYSSGTTGRPKGVLLSHRSRVLTFHAMAMEYGCYGPDDLQLGIAPMSHGAGFAFIMASLFFGGTVDILERFDAATVVRRLSEEVFTGVFMVPAHFHAIFSLPSATVDSWRGAPRTLRTIISNASSLPQSLKEKIISFWGPGLLHETYGSTEAGIVTNLRPADQLSRIASVGHPFALNEVKLLDSKGKEVECGEIGELYSRSPYIFSGYLDQPAETESAFRGNWVSAGDLARRDADGYIFIVDRIKDMVITGGFNVYPREIEEQIQKHPSVIEAAVIGVPNSRWGEALEAFIVLIDGAVIQDDELEQFCRSLLAGYKIPKRFYRIAILPRNNGGKILKHELRKQALMLCNEPEE